MLFRKRISARSLGELEAVQSSSSPAARARRPGGARAAWPFRCRRGRWLDFQAVERGEHSGVRRVELILDADEDVRFFRIGEAVVVLGDVERRARRRTFWGFRAFGDGEARIASRRALAQFRGAGDEAQAVEIGVAPPRTATSALAMDTVSLALGLIRRWRAAARAGRGWSGVLDRPQMVSRPTTIPDRQPCEWNVSFPDLLTGCCCGSSTWRGRRERRVMVLESTG